MNRTMLISALLAAVGESMVAAAAAAEALGAVAGAGEAAAGAAGEAIAEGAAEAAAEAAAEGAAEASAEAAGEGAAETVGEAAEGAAGEGEAAEGASESVKAAEEVEAGEAADVLNKAHHIFDKPQHNLDSVLNQFKGDSIAAYKALESATRAAAAAQKLTGTFETVVQVGGIDVTVRGAVIDGIARLGTAFIP